MAAHVFTGPVELLIDARVVDELDGEMRRAAPRRVAGFLLGESSGVVLSAHAVYPARRRGRTGGDGAAVSLTGADHRRALEKAQALGLKVIAVYRTHPDGDPSVSLGDVSGFRRSRLASLVVTARANGAQPRLDAYAPPTGAAMTVAVGKRE